MAEIEVSEKPHKKRQIVWLGKQSRVMTVVVASQDKVVSRLIENTLSSADYSILAFDQLADALKAPLGADPSLFLLDGHEVLEHLDEFSEIQTRWAGVQLLVFMSPDGIQNEPGLHQFPWTPEQQIEVPFSPLNLLKTVYSVLGSGVDPEAAKLPLHELERQQLLLYAQDLSRLRREDVRKSRQLQAANAKLQEFEKMKDMFLALVSHELRTPLTVMKGNTHLLRRFLKGAEAGSKEDKMSGFVQGLGAACDRLENLVSDLMSYSSARCGVEPFELRKVDLRQILTSVLLEHEGLAQTKLITLEFFPDNQETIIQGDAGRLKEAFSHLIKNAIYFNVPQGRVTVRCESQDTLVTLSVTDTGPGVPPDERERVFAPFYQAQDLLTRRVEGVGLGLAITRHIIESHGGQIWLAGELGHGTEVWVSLPSSPREYSDSEFAPKSPGEFEALLNQRADLEDGDLLEYARELYNAYDRERLRRRHLEERSYEIEKTFLETLAALMRQIDMRNQQHDSHNDRVVVVANEIARKIDPTLPKSRDFQLSLLLHDVGKIGVAESLLQKVGKLTNEETQAVRSHVNVGTEILGSIEFLQPALSTVRHHHERWDGKGYPDGLSGKSIPLWARILSVADSFGAMTTDRPYRKALSLGDALGEINKGSGTQYDPEVVATFNEVYQQMLPLLTAPEL